jgi:predicted HicB family RNase H-like nuclease
MLSALALTANQNRATSRAERTAPRPSTPVEDFTELQGERLMSNDIQTKAKTVLGMAEVFFNRKPDWVTFFKEVVGVNGVVHSSFSEPEALAAFKLTEEYAAIEQMLTRLREQVEEYPPKEAIRVITVRLPQSLHDSLTAEAKKYDTSVNKLCLSKLMRIIDRELIPADKPELAKELEASEP